jgi:predicted nuclease of predicted toxin-antitoxin system
LRDRSARSSLILLLDENLSGRSIIEGLTSCGIPVKPQTDLMERGVPDEEVLRVLSQYSDCFLLTKDSDFHKKPMIKEALIQHGVGAFVITAHKGKTAAELVALINKAWRRIQKFAEKHRRPFVVKILADGRIEEVE